MALTAEQVAAVGIWVDQFAAGMDQLKARIDAGLRVLYRGFDGWYEDRLVDEIARQTVDLLETDLDIVEGLAENYAANVLHELTGDPITILPTRLPQTRGGVDLVGVYRRPVEQYRHRVAVGMVPGEAREKSLRRLDRMVGMDLALAGRDAAVGQYEAKQVTTYRRVVHPELSRTGTCGLCIAASDRIYTTADLMPLHPGCHCTTAPIDGEDDPGNSLNNLNLAQLYADAGSTRAEELRQTRYQINDHGEYGPLLGFAGDGFKGPADTKPLEEDPERALRMLKLALPTLEKMRREGPADALGYQERLVDRLQQITA